MKSIIQKIQQYHKKTLNHKDFKLKCLNNQTLQLLLDISLQYEIDTFLKLDGENDLIADFHKQAMSKLCIVDVEYTLMQPEWKTFFSKHSK